MEQLERSIRSHNLAIRLISHIESQRMLPVFGRAVNLSWHIPFRIMHSQSIPEDHEGRSVEDVWPIPLQIGWTASRIMQADPLVVYHLEHGYSTGVRSVQSRFMLDSAYTRYR
jgi:hypothetical protein